VLPNSADVVSAITSSISSCKCVCVCVCVCVCARAGAFSFQNFQNFKFCTWRFVLKSIYILKVCPQVHIHILILILH
jgi:hypothetical protein